MEYNKQQLEAIFEALEWSEQSDTKYPLGTGIDLDNYIEQTNYRATKEICFWPSFEKPQKRSTNYTVGVWIIKRK